MKFQNCNLIFVTDTQTEGRMDKPKAICPLQLVKKSWGH